MPTIIDSVELDITNEEFNQAADFVSKTDKVIFLTGKAGTGKTTFLKYIKTLTDKNTVIVAPTGVAAINAGGITINSFFQIPFGPFVPDDNRLRTSKDLGDVNETTIYTTFRYREEKRNIINGLELLIIDEISMVRCDTLDVIDKILRVFRKNPNQPFGGVQVILIGDTFQLPPIASERSNEWQILSQFYESKFFFSSKVMERLIKEKRYVHFELKKIYRQKEQEFIDLLNRVRVNQIIDSDIKLLANKYNPTFTPSPIENYIILSTHNFQVDQTNRTKLDKLDKELVIFKGGLKGEFPKDSTGKYILPTELDLHLKEGAQVMFLKNDSGENKQYYNGKIGSVKTLSESNIIVEFSNGTSVLVEKATWDYIEYTWNNEKKKVEEKIKGTFTQYPLRLAWAITVHKSQGLTFEKVIADLGAAFEDGQVYVALSRSTSLTGLQLKTPISRNAIKANIKAVDFARNETPGTLITQQLNEGKADFYYKKTREAIKISSFYLAYESFKNALKFRNDIETDVFKRYFIAAASRMNSYKILSLNYLQELNEVKINLTELEHQNFEIQNVNEQNQHTIHEQSDAIKLLLKKTEELEFVKENKEKELIKTTKLLHEANNSLLEYEQKLQSVISEANQKVKLKENEINRLIALKWYQKLFGAK